MKIRLAFSYHWFTVPQMRILQANEQINIKVINKGENLYQVKIYKIQ
jgi:hypothetical protein